MEIDQKPEKRHNTRYLVGNREQFFEAEIVISSIRKTINSSFHHEKRDMRYSDAQIVANELAEVITAAPSGNQGWAE